MELVNAGNITALSVGAEGQATTSGGLSLSIVYRDADDNYAILHVLAPTDKVPSLIRDVSNQGLACIQDAADALAMGDCDTCGNRRLVPVEKHGRMSDEYCPACNASGRANGLATYPRFRRVTKAD